MMKRVHLSNTKKLFDFPNHFKPSDLEVLVRFNRRTGGKLETP